MLPKTRHQRRVFWVPLYLVPESLASPPRTQSHCLHVPILIIFPEHALPPPKKATSRSHTFYLVPPLMFLLYLVSSHLLISVPNHNHQWSSLDASISIVAVLWTHLFNTHFIELHIFNGLIVIYILDSSSSLVLRSQNIMCSFTGLIRLWHVFIFTAPLIIDACSFPNPQK
jgi:hypothetical protein